MLEEYRPRTLAFDDERDNRDKRKEDDANQKAHHDVERSLYELVGILRQWLTVVCQDDLLTKPLWFQIQMEIAEQAWDVIEMNEVSVAILHDAYDLLRVLVGQTTENLIYRLLVSLLFIHERVQFAQAADAFEFLRAILNDVVAIIALHLVAG